MISRLLWFAGGMVAWVLVSGLAGCATTARDQAITSCRQQGYLAATENAGVWYCFKDPLQLPKVTP